jgi:hypothetical protein
MGDIWFSINSDDIKKDLFKFKDLIIEYIMSDNPSVERKIGSSHLIRINSEISFSPEHLFSKDLYEINTYCKLDDFFNFFEEWISLNKEPGTDRDLIAMHYCGIAEYMPDEAKSIYINLFYNYCLYLNKKVESGEMEFIIL